MKYNVLFQERISFKKCQLDQIQNGRLTAIIDFDMRYIWKFVHRKTYRTISFPARRYMKPQFGVVGGGGGAGLPFILHKYITHGCSMCLLGVLNLNLFSLSQNTFRTTCNWVTVPFTGHTCTSETPWGFLSHSTQSLTSYIRPRCAFCSFVCFYHDGGVGG